MITNRTHKKNKEMELYDQTLLNEIFSDMKLQNDDLKKDLKITLELAARDFIKNWKQQALSRTEKQNITEIKKTLKYLNKCKNIYDNIAQSGVLIQTNPDTPNRTFYNPETYSQQLDTIIQDTEKVLLTPFQSTNKTKTRVVLSWIWRFSDFWETTEIALSEGRCDFDGQYNSKAISLLVKMLAPLRDHIDNPTALTTSLIAEALKQNRLYEKQGYLAAKPSGEIGTKDNPKVLKILDLR